MKRPERGQNVEAATGLLHLCDFASCLLASPQAMARDEKNYYQDTPKQIKRKINEYKRFHPEHYGAFMESLGVPQPMDQ